jgi:hypothetical protein
MEINQYIVLIFQRIADAGVIVKIKTFIFLTDKYKLHRAEIKAWAQPRQFSIFLL